MQQKHHQAVSTRQNGDLEKTKLKYETEVIILNQCRKIFVQRDYSKGLDVQFEAEYPARLTEKVSREAWENTIVRINKILADAESVNLTTFIETIMGCLTCYATHLLQKSQYRRKLDELQEFIDRENEEIYHKAGFHIRNPMERGLRVLEIALLSRYGESTMDEADGVSVQRASGAIRTI